MRRLIFGTLLCGSLAATAALSGAAVAATPGGAAPERQPRAEQAAAAPAAHVVEESLDLGTVREGEDVKATFVIENRGQAELRILRAKPS